MTIIEQLEALQAQKSDVDTKLTEAVAAIGSKDAHIADLNAKIEAHAAEIKDIEAKHSAALEGISAERDAALAGKTNAEAQIIEFQRKLEDPAYRMASVAGSDQAVSEGGVASGDAAVKSLSDQMREISDPKERRAFYLKHEKEIKAGL